MTRAFADRAERDEFRRKLLQMLRNGEAEAALDDVRSALGRLVGADEALVKFASSTRPEQITILGWSDLPRVLTKLDARGRVITALSIDLSWIGHVGTAEMLEPDADGRLAPHIETNYFSDLTELAFSNADRTALLSGYSLHSSSWQGGFEEIDHLIGTSGLERLYGAVQLAEKSGDEESTDGDAHALAACAVAILLHLAVKRVIQAKGLPRPMAVMVGSNEHFPFFDAPVVSAEESLSFAKASKDRTTTVASRPARTEQTAHDADASESVGQALRKRLNSPGEKAPTATPAPPTKSLIYRLFKR